MIKPEPPAAPAPSAASTRADASIALAGRYRRAQVYGLLLIAGAILAVSLFRADPHTLFPAGWWRF